jgi:hypothetical protein
MVGLARWAARWGTARCAGPRRVQRREPFHAPNLGQLRMVHHKHSVLVQRTESMRMQLVNGDRSLGERCTKSTRRWNAARAGAARRAPPQENRYRWAAAALRQAQSKLQRPYQSRSNQTLVSVPSLMTLSATPKSMQLFFTKPWV